MTIEIKLLDKSHMNQVIDLCCEDPYLWGMDLSKNEGSWSHWKQYISGTYDSNHTANFGAFINGQLTCYSYYYKWPNWPGGTLGLVKTRKRANLLHEQETGFFSTISALLDHAEQERVMQLFWIRKARTYKDRTLKAIDIILDQYVANRLKWDFHIYDSIAANSTSNYDFIQRMMGGKSWPIDLLCCTAILQDQYKIWIPNYNSSCSYLI